MSEAWRCQKGASVLVPSGPNDKRHMFAIMLDPLQVDGRGTRPCVLMACVVSVKDGVHPEDCCLLSPGDHPFIQHESYVDYRFTRLEFAGEVESRVAEGTFIPKDPCSPELVKKIIAGALKSRRISREFKAILQRVLFGA